MSQREREHRIAVDVEPNGLRVNKPSENILISDCTIARAAESRWLGNRRESATSLSAVANFSGTGGAVRIKSMRGRGGTVENITFEEITATNVASPIDINLSWGGNELEEIRRSENSPLIRPATPARLTCETS